jgi:hypothetical protein
MDSAPVRIVNNITACDEYLIFFESVAFGLMRRKAYCATPRRAPPLTAARERTIPHVGGGAYARMSDHSGIDPSLAMRHGYACSIADFYIIPFGWA